MAFNGIFLGGEGCSITPQVQTQWGPLPWELGCGHTLQSGRDAPPGCRPPLGLRMYVSYNGPSCAHLLMADTYTHGTQMPLGADSAFNRCGTYSPEGP
jgi:hypothetical protein